MRLIDADKIGLTDFEIIMCQGDYREAFKMLLDKINNQATVYGIDRVVEELKNKSFKAMNYPDSVVDLKEAIEIVKQGAIE